MEDLAYSCLLELVQRSMLQVGKLDSINGSIKTCQMHDFIRDLCIMKAQEENFMRVYENKDQVVDSSSSTTSDHVGLTFKKYRRVSVMNSKVGPKMNELLVSIKNLGGCLRAFVCFCEVRNSAKLFGYFQVL